MSLFDIFFTKKNKNEDKELNNLGLFKNAIQKLKKVDFSTFHLFNHLQSSNHHLLTLLLQN